MATRTEDYAFIDDLRKLIPEGQPQSIISRTFYTDEYSKAILFSFDAGQSLSEHTASKPATIHILQGEATITLGAETKEAGPGTWIHMRPNLIHSVLAKTPLLMLLTMLEVRQG